MKRAGTVLSVLFLATLWGFANGPASPLPGTSGPSPLLYLRLLGPAGAKFTVYHGGPAGTEFDSPLPLAVRPGYTYRVKLSNLARHPGVELYPTLEVRGTLHLPPHVAAAQHPAPVVFSDLEIERVLAGAFLTKVVVLEHPEKAAPLATVPDQPLEYELRAHEDMLEHARALGRPVLVIRLGGRTLPPEGMTTGIPNTMLLPGGKGLGQPPVAPFCDWASLPFYDPRLGARGVEEECLHDGGDSGRPVGLDRSGRLLGLDPADTVAEYTNKLGQRQLAVSNRVCVCVPRFTVLRTQVSPTGYDAARGLGVSGTVQAQMQFGTRQPPAAAHQREHLVLLGGRERPGALRSTLRTVHVDQTWGTATLTAEREPLTVVGLQEPEQPEGPAYPLQLAKWVDRHSVQIGDVVTFYLKYTNPGGQPISNVVLSDSLTGRLEYVAGSARSDRQANFTTQANEAGSLILRWEMGGKLLPGQSGMVSFQARIR